MFQNKTNNQYVGFGALPSQVHRRMVKRGFEFTLMLVGESGLGKSTLVSSIFNIDKQYGDVREMPTASQRATCSVEIASSNIDIIEKGIKLKLTIVDTPGYGENLTGEDQTTPIVNFIDNQFQQYFNDENSINRRHITDARVHCCFYFISPHSNGLRPVDVEFMKKLHDKVNIVPLIAKSDTLTIEEIKFKKSQILKDIQREQIKIYQLPDSEDEEDQTYKKQLNELKSAMPYAIVGSTDTFEVAGKKVRGRLYPWGVVEIENPKHSEFSLLRSMLITHMQDLQEVTHLLHYEKYRAQVIVTNSQSDRLEPSISMSRNNVDDVISEKDRQLQALKEKMMQMEMEMQMAQSIRNSNSGNSPSQSEIRGVTNNTSNKTTTPKCSTSTT